MEMSELAAYAREKYQIVEEQKWADFPGFSVLCHPHTGKWVALLMRQWDTDSGTEIERCDLKCGAQSLAEYHKRYLAPPIRMHGTKWISVAFADETEPDVVYKLFDRAVTSGEQRGFTMVLGQLAPPAEGAYRDTALPFAGSAYQPPKEAIPERLRQMRRMFEYGTQSAAEKANDFCRQAKFMESFEDDAPWVGGLFCYYPSYSDLTTRQLRGYFSWRARVRRGEFQPIPVSAAYLYLYELLNGIGADSPEDSLKKMKAFETGYLDAGYGDERMRQNLRRWTLEYAVIQGVPPDIARQYADPDMLRKDAALSVLKNPAGRTDEEVFSALCLFEGKLSQSPAVSTNAEKGKHLFSEIWRSAQIHCQNGKKTLFSECFGERTANRWYPLANALYRQGNQPDEYEYELDESRIYRCHGGIWQAEAWERLTFDRNRFHSFLRQADLMLRRFLRTGRYLHEKPEDAWAAPAAQAVIEAERRAETEAARPKITISLEGLEQIRRDAVTTRDSLLTEEEREETADEDYEDEAAPAAKEPKEEALKDVPLDTAQVQILCALLRNEPTAEMIRACHLTASLAADMINEALFDEIGDNVILCDNDRLSLAEDYRDDIAQMLGGMTL